MSWQDILKTSFPESTEGLFNQTKEKMRDIKAQLSGLNNSYTKTSLENIVDIYEQAKKAHRENSKKLLRFHLRTITIIGKEISDYFDAQYIVKGSDNERNIGADSFREYGAKASKENPTSAKDDISTRSPELQKGARTYPQGIEKVGKLFSKGKIDMKRYTELRKELMEIFGVEE